MTRGLILLAVGNHSASTKVTKLLPFRGTTRKGTRTSSPTVPFQDAPHARAKRPAHLRSDAVQLHSAPLLVTVEASVESSGHFQKTEAQSAGCLVLDQRQSMPASGLG